GGLELAGCIRGRFPTGSSVESEDQAPTCARSFCLEVSEEGIDLTARRGYWRAFVAVRRDVRHVDCSSYLIGPGGSFGALPTVREISRRENHIGVSRGPKDPISPTSYLTSERRKAARPARACLRINQYL